MLKFVRFVFLNLLLFSLPLNVTANVAAPSQGGNPAAEPSGLKEVFITRETLNIDLRPLAKGSSSDEQLISVEAIYELENKGAEKKLDLVFAFGSSFKDFQIRLDEQEISSQTIDNANAPQSWKAPQNTPWLDGRKLDYAPSFGGYKNNKSTAFSVVLPAGKHRLHARYKADPTNYSSNPLRYWQFAYILAPAREWAGFGGLEITINVPKDWIVVTNPALQREGETLKAHFDQIPADALALTAQAPLPASYNTLNAIFQLLFLATLLGFPLLLTAFAITKGYKLKLSWLWGIGFTLLWTILVFITGFLSAYGANYAIPQNQYSSYGYDGIMYGFGIIIAGAAVFVTGLILWFLTTFVMNKIRNKKLA